MHLRISLLLILWLMFGATGLGLAQSARQGDTRPRRYDVSESTTHFTEPLAEDGSIDFAAAINLAARKKLGPNENAAVVLFPVLDETRFGAASATFVRSELGITVAQSADVKFIPYSQFATTVEDPRQELRDATAHVWTAQSEPRIAAWLKANENALEVAIEASRKPGWYFPVIDDPSEKSLIHALTEVQYQCRGITDALLARAMLYASEKNYQACWSDLLATTRLGTLIGNGPLGVHGIYGSTIVRSATERARTLLILLSVESQDLDWNQMLADWDAESRVADYGFQMDCGERAVVLQAITNSADGKPLADLLKDTAERLALHRIEEWPAGSWNPALTWTNTYFDRAVAHWNNPSPEEQIRGFEELSDRLERLSVEMKDPLAAFADISKNDPEKLATRVAAVYMTLIVPSSEAVQVSESRTRGNKYLIEIGLASLAYREKHGRWPVSPDELHDLVPPHLFIYPRTGAPFRFVSKDGTIKISHSGMGKEWNDDKPKLEYFTEPPQDDWEIHLGLPAREQN